MGRKKRHQRRATPALGIECGSPRRFNGFAVSGGGCNGADAVSLSLLTLNSCTIYRTTANAS